jgi:ribosomal-protein-alanine N-acetyltransferase
MPSIKTHRCELSVPTIEDRAHLIRLYTDSTVRAYLGGPVTYEEAGRRVDELTAQHQNEQAWVVRRDIDGSFLGLVSLGAHHDGSDTEVSYMLLPEFQGFGYAQEAVGAILAYALETLQLPRVVAETQVVNARSCRLLQRLGMSLDRRIVRFNAEQVIYAKSAVRPA